MKKIARSIVLSPYMDLFGAALVLCVCLSLRFHFTLFYRGEIVSENVNFHNYFDYLKTGAFPLGIFSTVGAVFSLLSTRFVGKQNNIGNVIGILTTINSGVIDYLFGNHSAIITYPLTFIITTFAFVKWKTGQKIRKIDFLYYIVNFYGIIISYILVYLGMKLFGGRTDDLFFHIISISFGLSLGANFCSALKYESTFLSWSVYNLVQLSKAFIQGNLANVVKYIFYMLNAIVTSADWIWNRDVLPYKNKVKTIKE